MSTRNLHPLACQAMELLDRREGNGWALGLTKYLAHRNPLDCVKWTLDLLTPYIHDTGEYGQVVSRTIGLLNKVLTEPNSAVLRTLDQAASEAWSYRWATRGLGPVARLLWAAMGAVKLGQERKEASSEIPQLSHADEDRNKLAVVWEQCATAIHVLANEEPRIPSVIAQVFTTTVCHPDPPSSFEVIRRLEWSWERFSFGISVLRDSEKAFYLEFFDQRGDGPLFSGPFASIDEADDRLKLLKHQPVSIRLQLNLPSRPPRGNRTIFAGTILGTFIGLLLYKPTPPEVEDPLMDPTMIIIMGMEMGFLLGVVVAAIDGQNIDNFLYLIIAITMFGGLLLLSIL